MSDSRLFIERMDLINATVNHLEKEICNFIIEKARDNIFTIKDIVDYMKERNNVIFRMRDVKMFLTSLIQRDVLAKSSNYYIAFEERYLDGKKF